MKKILTILAIVACLLTQATTYYISPTGSDSNNGTSPATAWKTIAKANSKASSLSAGDQFLFQKNGTYRGALLINRSGTATKPIIVSSYGEGAAPVFLGSQSLTWTVHKYNIYKTTVTATVPLMFQDGKLLELARFPNTGWLRNDNGTNTVINDAELGQNDGYWNGARAVVRTSAWSYTNTTVSSYTKGKLTVGSLSGYNLSNRQWGYFLCNKLSELDVPGEWFWDSSTKTLYVWAIGSANPNTSNIEVATQPYGIRIGSGIQYVKVSGISCKYYTERAFYISGSNNTIENCAVEKSMKGVTIYGNGNIVRGNTFSNIYATSVFITPGDNNIIELNTFTDCALVPGLGESNWGYFGIRASGKGNIIRKNALTRIGYIGILFTDNALVEYNKVENACYALSDGAGISFDQVDGAIVRGNIILSTLGNVESCAPNYNGCDPKGKGIYFGNVSLKNTLVTENTVAYCNGAGIWVDHTMLSEGNVITNNQLFSNTQHQLGISDYSNYNGTGAVSPYAVARYNDVYSGNVCYSTDASQACLYMINRWYNGFLDYGEFGHNYYYNPWTPTPVTIERFLPSNVKTNYSLQQWQNLIEHNDIGSVQGVFSPSSSKNNHILVYNDQMFAKSVDLPSGTWSDVYGNKYMASVSLDSYKSKILYRDITTPLCTFTYGAWTSCVNNKKVRTYTTSPNGCYGTPPVDSISVACTPPVNCVSYTYETTSLCWNGTWATRSAIGLPNGCVNANPPADSLSRACPSQPPISASTAFDPADLTIVVNSADPTSQGMANAYLLAWNVPLANMIVVDLGPDEVLASSSKLNTARTKIAENGKQAVLLAMKLPHHYGNGQSITSAITFGSRNVSNLTVSTLYNYKGEQPFTDLGFRPSFLLRSANYIRKDGHGLNPTGKSYMILARENPSMGNPRGHARKGQTSAVNVVWDNLNTTVGGGANDCNNLSQNCWIKDGGVSRKPIEPVIAYFGSNFNTCCDLGVVWRKGMYMDRVTSTSGALPSGAGQTPLTWELDRGAGAVCGTVIEPWQDKSGNSPGSLVEQFVNATVLMPLYLQGKSMITSTWAAVKCPDRTLFVGDPLVAPFAK